MYIIMFIVIQQHQRLHCDFYYYFFFHLKETLYILGFYFIIIIIEYVCNNKNIIL